MATIISDRGRPWYPAIEAFRPDPPSDLALVLFWREAQRRFGLRRSEAATIFYACCGYTTNEQIAALRGCALNTVKNTKTDLWERLGLPGIHDTPSMMVRFWPLYCAARRAASMARTIKEDDDAPGLATPRSGIISPSEYGKPGGVASAPGATSGMEVPRCTPSVSHEQSRASAPSAEN